MFFDSKDGISIREELGLTVERGDELSKIMRTAIDQCTSAEGYGRTSHVLLNIAGRKDLNDVEKVACVYLFFSNTIFDKSSIDKSNIDKSNMDTLRIKNIDITKNMTRMTGMMIAPQEVEPIELITVLLSSILVILRDMPKSSAREFCSEISMSFAKMAFTGDIHL